MKILDPEDEIYLLIYRKSNGRFASKCPRYSPGTAIGITTIELSEMYHTFMAWYGTLWALLSVEERSQAERAERKMNDERCSSCRINNPRGCAELCPCPCHKP